MYYFFFSDSVTPKDGVCPIIDSGICIQECHYDNDCSGIRKCCGTGCGFICEEPGNPEWLLLTLYYIFKNGSETSTF